MVRNKQTNKKRIKAWGDGLSCPPVTQCNCESSCFVGFQREKPGVRLEFSWGRKGAPRRLSILMQKFYLLVKTHFFLLCDRYVL